MAAKTQTDVLRGEDLEAIHRIVAKYGYEKHEFFGHLLHTWNRFADHDGPPTYTQLWIIRAPMSGLGQIPKQFGMPFDEKMQAAFESHVGLGTMGRWICSSKNWAGHNSRHRLCVPAVIAIRDFSAPA